MDDTDYNNVNYMGPAQGDNYSMTPSWQDQFMGGLHDAGAGIKGMYDRFTAPSTLTDAEKAAKNKQSADAMKGYADYKAAEAKKLTTRPAMPTSYLHDYLSAAPAEYRERTFAAGGLADLAAGQTPQPGMLGMQGTPDGTQRPPISQDGYGLGRLNTMTMNQGNAQGQNGNYAGFAKGGYLDGGGDGMSDSIPASIEGNQPAALADGEFVIPADVVSHLGNGSTKAGAKRLYHMLDQIRKARTGHTKQGKQIDANKFLPH